MDISIRILMALLLVFFFVIRAYHHRKAIKEGGTIEYKEPNRGLIALMRIGLGIVMLGAMILYFIDPALVGFAAVPLPLWVRLGGLAIGYLSLPLIWWTEWALGLNFNTTLHIREGHTLVRHGPYQWVRHPMYTSLFLIALSWLLASANLLIGLPGVLGILTIVINRVNREESVMMEQFGEQYRTYMQRTGRFLPRF